MRPSPSAGSPRVAHSVLAGSEIARLVDEHYDVGGVDTATLLRSGYNEVYRIVCTDGSRRVARLGAIRARGEANTDYEVSMLLHMAAGGALVAAPLRARSGAACVWAAAPEGRRPLVVFEHLDGEPPESPTDIELTGAGLARLHEAAEGYAGPASRYRYDLDHLLRTPLGWLLQAPTLDDTLRERFRASAIAVEADFGTPEGLREVACHGDCHGGNNFIAAGRDGEPDAVFFDFDDAAPGFLGYDLAVFLWSYLLRDGLPSPDDEVRETWKRFLSGYASVRALAAPDLASVAAHVRMRHVLWLGERASRCSQWGSEALPTRWLRKQADLLDAWATLDTSTPADDVR